MIYCIILIILIISTGLVLLWMAYDYFKSINKPHAPQILKDGINDIFKQDKDND